MDVLSLVPLKLRFYYICFAFSWRLILSWNHFFATNVNKPRCCGDYHVNIYQHVKSFTIKEISNIVKIKSAYRPSQVHVRYYHPFWDSLHKMRNSYVYYDTLSYTLSIIISWVLYNKQSRLSWNSLIRCHDWACALLTCKTFESTELFNSYSIGVMTDEPFSLHDTD